MPVFADAMPKPVSTYALVRRFTAVAEDHPGAVWRALLAEHWPGWRAW